MSDELSFLQISRGLEAENLCLHFFHSLTNLKNEMTFYLYGLEILWDLMCFIFSCQQEWLVQRNKSCYFPGFTQLISQQHSVICFYIIRIRSQIICSLIYRKISFAFAKMWHILSEYLIQITITIKQKLCKLSKTQSECECFCVKQ